MSLFLLNPVYAHTEALEGTLKCRRHPRIPELNAADHGNTSMRAKSFRNVYATNVFGSTRLVVNRKEC